MDIAKALLVKSFSELLTITACLYHNNKIKLQIFKRKRSEWVHRSLPYIEGSGEKLRGRSGSHEIRLIFYNERTLHKLLGKSKDRVASKNKNNIVYEISLLYKAVYFVECKQSLKSFLDEQKRSVKNCDCEKNEFAKHDWEVDHNFIWDQKKVVDSESRLISSKIKEKIHSLKNLNHVNKNFLRASWNTAS